jgi:hypothetical protein
MKMGLQNYAVIPIENSYIKLTVTRLIVYEV